MSNYFQLIQNVSVVKLGKAPTSFTEITNRKYNKIKEEINNTLNDFFRNNTYGFRRKTAVLNTVIGQQFYVHSYDTIIENGITLDDGNGNRSIVAFNHDVNNLLLRKTTSFGTPTEFTIDEGQIYLYPVPDKIYALTIKANTSFCAVTYSNDIPPVGTPVRIMANETDTPNFDSKYHYILEYGALMRLYESNQHKLGKYQSLYNDALNVISSEARGTQEQISRIKFTNVNW